MNERRPSRRVLLAVALITACTLAFQVVLTRLLAAVLAYHFSFLAISLALLGTGGGALIVYVRPGWFDRRPLESALGAWAVAYAALLIVAPFVLAHIEFSFDQDVTFAFALKLAFTCVLAALPAFAAGIVVALAIRGYATWVGRVYAWDLVGAGLGAGIIVPALFYPPPAVMIVIGIVAAIAAVLFATGSGAVARAGLIVAASGVVLTVIAGSTSILYIAPNYPQPSGSKRVADLWTPLSRVQGFRFPISGGFAAFAALFYDRVSTPVPVVRNGVIPDWSAMKVGPQSIGYELSGPGGHALVIGGGGGRDIYNALAEKQRPVDVIELNAGIRHVVDVDLGELSGRPYTLPGVHTTIGDGRSVLASRKTKYNQIHIGFTDTLSANSAQGFALTENNLYTKQAFDEYFDHLRPNGVLNVSRRIKLVGQEALRATVLTYAALEHRGVKDPSRNVVVIRGRDLFGEKYGTVLARLTPYSDGELARIKDLAAQRGLGLLSSPGGPYVGAWKELHDAPGWNTFCTHYSLNVCPPTDDKPFFFNMKRISQIGSKSKGYIYGADPYDVLMLTLGILTVLAIIAFLMPLPLASSVTRPKLSALLYFALIGLGFLVLEIVLVQRFVLFLGFPTYALSVVLFSLLVFSGIGSYLSSRLPRNRRTLEVVLVLIALVIGATAYGLQPLLSSLIDWPFPARAMFSVAFLVPYGVLMGMALPLGLRRFEALYPRSVAYAWGVNGVASVLASVLGVAVAINWGFAVASLVAASCYVGALVHVTVGRWPMGGGLESQESDAPGKSRNDRVAVESA